MHRNRLTIALSLVLLLLSMRLAPAILMQLMGPSFHMIRFPYLWNFTPLFAVCLYGGAVLRPRWMGFAIPLVAQVLGDIVFGLMSGEVWQAVSISTLVNYVLVGFSVVAGMTLQPRPALGRLFGTGAGVAIGHFLISNLAVWGLYQWYPHSLEGLAECFAQALPFFPTTVISTLFFSYLLFYSFVPDHEAAPAAEAESFV